MENIMGKKMSKKAIEATIESRDWTAAIGEYLNKSENNRLAAGVAYSWAIAGGTRQSDIVEATGRSKSVVSRVALIGDVLTVLHGPIADPDSFTFDAVDRLVAVVAWGNGGHLKSGDLRKAAKDGAKSVREFLNTPAPEKGDKSEKSAEKAGTIDAAEKVKSTSRGESGPVGLSHEWMMAAADSELLDTVRAACAVLADRGHDVSALLADVVVGV